MFGSPPGGPYLAALDVAILVAISTALRTGRTQSSPIGWAAAAFFVVSLLSLVPFHYAPPSWRPSVLVGLLQSLTGVESWHALYTWRAAADLVLGYCLFFATRRAFANQPLRPFVLGVFLSLTVLLLVGLASFFELVDLGGFRPNRYLQMASRRMASLFFLSGWLSQYIILAAPIALSSLVGRTRWRRHLFLPALILISVCLALTKQQGAWLAAVAQLSCWAALTFPHWGRRLQHHLKVFAPVLVAGSLAIGLVAITDGSRISSLAQRVISEDAGFSGRTSLWNSAVEMTKTRPLLGWGLGSFSPTYSVLSSAGTVDNRPFHATAHNLYLHVSAERGILGFLALGLLGWATASCLRRPLPGQEAIAKALSLSFVGAVVYGLVQYPFHLRSISCLLWVLLAMVTATTRMGNSFRSKRAASILVLAALIVTPFRTLGYPPPLLAGNHSFGFHKTEPQSGGSFRWTEGIATERIAWIGDTLILTLANGHPLASEHPVTVSVSLDGKLLTHLTISGSWEEHRFETGQPFADTLLLTLKVHPTFRPFSDYRKYPQLPHTTDIRNLGVAVQAPRWESSSRSFRHQEYDITEGPQKPIELSAALQKTLSGD